jgi:lipid II isoglutaminyl synthase (glutamine-hydrolysing)
MEQCNNKTMNNALLIALGKTISKISKLLNRGNGSTWPGHIALKGNSNFIHDILSNSKTKVIIVAGTNGKTTTAGLIRAGLEKNGKTVLHNESGANLLNGIASTILLNTNANGELVKDYAIFEVDENTIPLVLKQITPDYLVLLNLFRDQLDRYGEINTIVKKWQEAVISLPSETTLVLNADDPQVAYMGRLLKHKTRYFGLDRTEITSQSKIAADSISCPHCGKKLTFEYVAFSHLGKWKCPSCRLMQPERMIVTYSDYPLTGTYNKYNTHAAVLVLRDVGLDEQQIQTAFKTFTPSFGRQEKISYQGKNVQLFLSKNPTSFNQSFSTISELNASTLLIVLNDRIPDGRDISWIWDTDLSGIEKYTSIILSGDRVYDMALRLKYALGTANYKKVKIYENLKEAINNALENLSANKTLYILPNYSAMLEVRKILTGKKIL